MVVGPSTRSWAITFADPVPYLEGVRIQEAIHAARLADAIPDTVLLLEHRPVITLGRRGRDQFLLSSRAALAERGVDLFTSSRGGDVTYHGPGQWVLYPILKLGGSEASSRGYLHHLEEVAIRTAGSFGVTAYRREGMNGAWTDAGKLSAIGFHIKRWVTLHGLSFNVRSGLDGFRHIVGCGLVGEKVVSLEEVVPGDPKPDMGEVGMALLNAFSGVMGRCLDVYPWQGGGLPEVLAQIRRPESS